MKDSTSPISAADNVALTATPIDIVVNGGDLWVNVANNVLMGSSAGTTVNILRNGAGPPFLVPYGAQVSHHLGAGTNWIRIVGAGAVVSYSVTTAPAPIGVSIVQSNPAFAAEFAVQNVPSGTPTTILTCPAGSALTIYTILALPSALPATWEMYITDPTLPGTNDYLTASSGDSIASTSPQWVAGRGYGATRQFQGGIPMIAGEQLVGYLVTAGTITVSVVYLLKPLD